MAEAVNGWNHRIRLRGVGKPSGRNRWDCDGRRPQPLGSGLGAAAAAAALKERNGAGERNPIESRDARGMNE